MAPAETFIVHRSSFPNRGFQLPYLLNLHRALFPLVFWYKGPGQVMGLLAGQLSFLWLVGLAFSLADPVFNGDGLLVWLMAQLFRPAFRNARALEFR